MSCERFSGAVIDHACGAPIDNAAAAHLRACGACRQAFDEYRRLLTESDAVLRSELAIVASPDFAARVSAKTTQLDAPASRWLLPARWWLGVGAAATAIAISVYVSAPVERPAHPIASRQVPLPSVHLPAEPANAVESASADPVPERRALQTSTPRVVNVSAPRSGRSSVPEAPVVIVPPAQRRAIARLQELLRSGALDETPVPAAGETAELCIEPLIIPELTIPALPAAGGQGAAVSDKD